MPSLVGYVWAMLVEPRIWRLQTEADPRTPVAEVIAYENWLDLDAC